jgi:hypothetical protein
MFVDRVSRYIRVMKTNLNYLSSVYFVNQPLHVSGIFVAHHQEVYTIYTACTNCCGSRDSVARIATRYGVEGPGIESRWGEIFLTYPDLLRGPPSLLYNGYRVFPGGKGGRDVMLTTHLLLVPRLRKSWAIPPLTLWVLLGLLRGSIYIAFTSCCIYIRYTSWWLATNVPESCRSWLTK